MYKNKRHVSIGLQKDDESPRVSSFQIHNLEEALRSTNVEYAQRLSPLNQLILNLQAELKEVRAQVERHVENNKDLLCVKMKLEAEINNYQQLMQDMTADTER